MLSLTLSYSVYGRDNFALAPLLLNSTQAAFFPAVYATGAPRQKRRMRKALGVFVDILLNSGLFSKE